MVEGDYVFRGIAVILIHVVPEDAICSANEIQGGVNRKRLNLAEVQ